MEGLGTLGKGFCLVAATLPDGMASLAGLSAFGRGREVAVCTDEPWRNRTGVGKHPARGEAWKGVGAIKGGAVGVFRAGEVLELVALGSAVVMPGSEVDAPVVVTCKHCVLLVAPFTSPCRYRAPGHSPAYVPALLCYFTMLLGALRAK